MEDWDTIHLGSNTDSMPMGPGSGHPGSDPLASDTSSTSSDYGDSGIGVRPSSGSSSTISQSDTSADQEGVEASLSDYMKNHPGASYEDYLKWMAYHSDEWAEKYLDYLTEKGEIDKQNQYTASREDTAYQRLMTDLKKAAEGRLDGIGFISPRSSSCKEAVRRCGS